MPDSEVSNLHKSFDLIFKNSNLDVQDVQQQQSNLVKKNRIKEISLDLHVSSQMILIYPDIDSENLIKDIVSSFSTMAYKHSKFYKIYFFCFVRSELLKRLKLKLNLK